MSASDLGPGQVKFTSGGRGRGNFGGRRYHGLGDGGNFPKAIFIVMAVAGLFYLNDSCHSSNEIKVPPSMTSFSIPPSPSAPPGVGSPVTTPPSGSDTNTGGIDFENVARFPQQIRLLPILTTCSEGWKMPGCLPAAPAKPSKVAAFSFQGHDHVAGNDIALVVSAEHIHAIIVNSYDELPADVKQAGIEIHSAADFASIRRNVQSTLLSDQPAKSQSLIFHGDVRVDVGPLVNEDKMLSMLVVQNSDIKSYEMFYHASSPRGPPSVPLLTAYVIGQVEKYEGPDESNKSVHTAGVFDIDLSPSLDQQIAYDAALKRWRYDLAVKAGMGAELFQNVSNDDAAVKLIEAHSQRSSLDHGVNGSGALHPHGWDSANFGHNNKNSSPERFNSVRNPYPEWRMNRGEPYRPVEVSHPPARVIP